MQVQALNTYFPIFRGEKVIGRAVLQKTDMSGIDNPRSFKTDGTLFFWGKYADLSDGDGCEEKTLKEFIRSLLKEHLQKNPEDKNVQFVLENASVSLLYAALQCCDEYAIRLLHAEDNGEGGTKITLVGTPKEANGVIYAEYGPNNRLPDCIRDSKKVWKELEEQVLESEALFYDRYTQNKVYTVAIDAWQGHDDPSMHLEDGEGFENFSLYNTFLDPDDHDDAVEIEDEILTAFRH